MMEVMPPMPLDTTTPSRSGSTSGLPASAHASRAATMASCSHRSSRRACTRSSTVAGSTAEGAAICTGRSGAQSSGSLRAPLRPASSDSHVEGTSPPTGEIAPRPVTTTRGWSARTVDRSLDSVDGNLRPGPQAGGRRPARSGRNARAAHVVDDVLDRLEVLQLVVGDLHPELVLGGHGDLDHGQRVDIEVVDKALVGGDLVGGDARDLVDDLAETGQDFLLGHGHLSVFSFVGCGRARSAGPGARARLRNRDHLGGIADPGPETEQQNGFARADL